MGRMKRYHKILILLGLLVTSALIYLRLRPADTMTDLYYGEAGYLEGYEEESERTDQPGVQIAEGLEKVFLPPGTFHLSIDATTDGDGAYYEIVDRATNEVYYRGEYTPGEHYHGGSFTTTEYLRDMVIRSYAGSGTLNIYGYAMSSEGANCTDARWSVVFFALFAVLLYTGIRRALRQQWNLLLLSVFATAVSLPHLIQYLPHGHDIEFHLIRLYGLAESIQAGNLFWRIDGVPAGGGYITPIMYPWVMLLPGALLVLGGTTILFAWKMVLIFLNFLTVFLSFYAARKDLGERGALLFAFLYTLNPYRLMDIYTRAAIGEAFAMAFLPLFVFALEGILRRKQRRDVLLFAFALAGLLSSHIISVMLCAVLCLLRFVGEFVWNPREWKRILFAGGRLAAGVVLAALAQLWFLVPFLSYSGNDFYIASNHSLEGTSVTLWQVFMNPVEFGYNIDGSIIQGEMSLTIGVVVLLGLILYGLLRIKGSLSSLECRTGDAAAALVMLAVFCASDLFPWDSLVAGNALLNETFGNMQFAWRFLMLAAVFGSIVTTVVVNHCWTGKRWISCAMLVICGLTAVTCATEYTKNPVKNDSKWTYNWLIYWDYNETFVRDNMNEIYQWCVKGEGPKSEEPVEIADYHRDGINYEFRTVNAAQKDAVVTVPIFYYGLYQAVLEGENGTQQLATAMNPENQFTDVTVPTGAEGSIRLEYQEPVLWKLCDGISVLSWVIILAGIVCGIRFGRSGRQLFTQAKTIRMQQNDK